MPALRKLAFSLAFSFLAFVHMTPFFLLRVLASTLGALLFLRLELQKTGCTQPSWGVWDQQTCL